VAPVSRESESLAAFSRDLGSRRRLATEKRASLSDANSALRWRRELLLHAVGPDL